MQGSVGSLHLRVKRFPCRLNSKMGERTYVYDDFGIEFNNELSYKQVSNSAQVCQAFLTPSENMHKLFYLIGF